MTRSRRRGFTLVEACVCILIVSLLSALAYPNVISQARSRTERQFKLQLSTIVLQARTRAIETHRTVALTYDKGNRAIKAEEEDPTGISQPLKDLPIPDQIEATQFFADKEESPSDGWRVPFFADGATTGGGIQFDSKGNLFSLVISDYTSKAAVIDGGLPDLSQESWSAGGVQKRAS